MRPWSVASALVLALTVAASVPAGLQARGPDPSMPPTEGDIALTLVRAQDARFADLPTTDEVQRLIASTFDSTPIMAGSWIGVVNTFGTITDFGVPGPAWLDLGTGRIVEVMLVAGCPDSVKGHLDSTSPDPCGWRHTWLYHVAADGTVTVVAEAGSRDTPACYAFHASEGITWPPDTESLVCGASA